MALKAFDSFWGSAQGETIAIFTSQRKTVPFHAVLALVGSPSDAQEVQGKQHNPTGRCPQRERTLENTPARPDAAGTNQIIDKFVFLLFCFCI